MPKLILQNCQRIVESTEFDLEGLGFLVGPNNSGKGVIKDALVFLNALFSSSENNSLHDAKEGLFRRPAELLHISDITRRLMEYEKDRNRIPVHYIAPDFESEQVRRVSFEFEQSAVFKTEPIARYSSDNAIYDWCDLVEEEPSEAVSQRVIGQKVRITYEQFDIPSQHWHGETISRFSICCSDAPILQIVSLGFRAQLILDLNEIQKIGHPIEKELLSPSPGLQLTYKEGLPIHLGSASGSRGCQGFDSDYCYFVDSNFFIFNGEYLGEYELDGRLGIPAGMHPFESYFADFPEENHRARGFIALAERLLQFCKRHMNDICRSTFLVPGDRNLPSKEALTNRFKLQDQVKRLIKGKYEPKLPCQGPHDLDWRHAQESITPEVSELYKWVILDSLCRSEGLKGMAQLEAKQQDEYYAKRSDDLDHRLTEIWDMSPTESLLNKVNEDLKKLCGTSLPPSLSVHFRIVDMDADHLDAGNLISNLSAAEMSGALFLQTIDGRRVEFNQIGSAIGYVLPVLILLRNQDSSLVGFIEQPELHLHPKMQGDLGELFFHTAGKRFPLFVETHSENLILRVLRKIRENYRESIRSSIQDPSQFSDALQGKDVRFYYFQPVDETSTRVHSLNVSPSGHFYEPWPDGFFEERDNDLDSLL